jgi:hypothetical protein
MPDNPWIWVLAIVAGVAVLIFALRRGGKVEAGVGPTSLKFEARKEPEATEVSVLDKGRLKGSTVGDVSGISGAAPTGPTRVEVAKGAEITGSAVGDISGVRLDGGKRGPAGEP